MKKYYYIGKTNADKLGQKGPLKYILSSLSKTKKECEAMTNFLAGFGGYEVVRVEIKQTEKVKVQRKPLFSKEVRKVFSQIDDLEKKLKKNMSGENPLLKGPAPNTATERAYGKRIYGASLLGDPELIAFQKAENKNLSDRIDKSNKKVRGKK